MTSPSSATEKEVQPSVNAATLIKKRGAFDIIRAALFSPSNDAKNAAKLAAVDDNKPSIWANLICGIRPLHHPQFDYVDEEKEPVIVPRPAARPMPLPLKLHSVFHDVRPLPPPSPAGYTSGVDEGMSSRYASAEDLQALDGGTGSDDDAAAEEEEEEEEGCGNKGDINAIDVKAEEFIAKFYEQMRLQRVDSVDLS